MCGIAGFQGTFPDELLPAMAAAIEHRGPDGEGWHVVGDESPAGGTRTGLAHRRLAIIDLSPAGRQPMTVECDRCGCADLDDLALTFNGEIYNFAELRRKLEGTGHVFRSATDSEVLLHLYAEHGLGMLQHLNGIFAFAILDRRTRGRPPGVERGSLFIARDQLGVKPLYHASTAAGYLFASEIKALLRSAEVARELDPVALHQQLALLWTPAPRTALRSVHKLPPGCAQLVHDGRVLREWRYYDLPYGDEPLTGSAADIAEMVQHAVKRAVERQLVADVPVGAFLSGGVDSTAIVAMMRELKPQERPRCFCIGFRGKDDLEGSPADLPYAARAAARLGADLRSIEIGPDSIGRLDTMLYYLDEPQADPAPINALIIAEAAREEGIPVLLSGAGGDDLFSGYRRHFAVRYGAVWNRLPQRWRSYVAARVHAFGSGSGVGMDSAFARRVVRLLQNAGEDSDNRIVGYFAWSGERTRRGLYSAAFADTLDGVEATSPLLESLERIPHVADPLDRMLYLEAKHFLADHNLNYTDKMGMAAGVEVRVPLLDLDLVNLAARIPSQYKQTWTQGKAILKRALRNSVPGEVIRRRKSGFGAPVRRWLRHELRDRVEDVLSPDSLTNRGIFDPAAVRQLMEQDRSGRIDGSYTIFALLCFELWCRQFIDGNMPGGAAIRAAGSSSASAARC